MKTTTPTLSRFYFTAKPKLQPSSSSDTRHTTNTQNKFSKKTFFDLPTKNTLQSRNENPSFELGDEELIDVDLNPKLEGLNQNKKNSFIDYFKRTDNDCTQTLSKAKPFVFSSIYVPQTTNNSNNSNETPTDYSNESSLSRKATGTMANSQPSKISFSTVQQHYMKEPMANTPKVEAPIDNCNKFSSDYKDTQTITNSQSCRYSFSTMQQIGQRQSVEGGEPTDNCEDLYDNLKNNQKTFQFPKFSFLALQEKLRKKTAKSFLKGTTSDDYNKPPANPEDPLMIGNVQPTRFSFFRRQEKLAQKPVVGSLVETGQTLTDDSKHLSKTPPSMANPQLSGLSYQATQQQFWKKPLMGLPVEEMTTSDYSELPLRSKEHQMPSNFPISFPTVHQQVLREKPVADVRPIIANENSKTKSTLNPYKLLSSTPAENSSQTWSELDRYLKNRERERMLLSSLYSDTPSLKGNSTPPYTPQPFASHHLDYGFQRGIGEGLSSHFGQQSNALFPRSAPEFDKAPAKGVRIAIDELHKNIDITLRPQAPSYLRGVLPQPYMDNQNILSVRVKSVFALNYIYFSCS